MGRTTRPVGGSSAGCCKVGSSSDRDRKEGTGSSRYRDWPGTKYDKQACSTKSDGQDRARYIGGVTVSLIYAQVSREGTILTECQVGNHDISDDIISTILSNSGSSPYTWKKFHIHHVSKDGLTFLVVVNNSVNLTVPNAFLNALQRQFVPLTSSISLCSLPARSLQGRFYPTLSSLMNTYNTAARVDDTNTGTRVDITNTVARVNDTNIVAQVDDTNTVALSAI